MNLNLKILNVDAVEGTAVVRFWTDLVTEQSLATQVDSEGFIQSCRTDFNCWLPPVPLQGEDLIDYFRQFAPVKLFENMEQHLMGTPVDASGAQALLGQTLVKATDTTVTLEQAKTLKKAAIAAWRYRRETAGVLLGDVRISTDPGSQGKIAGALTSMQAGFITSTPWKGENGWIDVGLDQVTAIARAVAEHVQSCFTQERDLVEQVDACTSIEQVDAITLV